MMPSPCRSFRLDLAVRGYQVLYHRDGTNHCPGCGKVQWSVGRITAECVLCGTALPLAESELGGFSPGGQRPVALHVVDGGKSADAAEKRKHMRNAAPGKTLGLLLDGVAHPFLIYNMSDSGVMGNALPEVGAAQSIVIELEDGSLVPAELKWTDGKHAGLAFLASDGSDIH
jgi:hypothetical protein